MKKANLDSPATKGDLQKFVTKRDLKEVIKPLATKEELRKAIKPLATKEELRKAIKPLATKEELSEKIDSVEKRLRAEIKITAQETKEEIRENIKESKSEILNVLDVFLKETETSRQERAFAAHQAAEDRKKIEDHETRITFLEQGAVPPAS